MTTWFTADTHFGHANILKHCNRPFGSVDEMDAALIANWNARVALDDDIWCLGDFCRGAPDRYGSRLNGRKHLITGNHDKHAVRAWDGWTSVQPYTELKLDGARLILFHYPIAEWAGFFHGNLHLYGHVHGSREATHQSCDVGVDVWDYRPVSLPEIKAVMATR